ncbi:amino acid adenylation domain-containing protein, partial [Flavitalea flava]
LGPDHLAYVIYTSGSTGQPKGVMIEHKGVVNLAQSQVGPLGLHPGIVVFQFASFSFDASCYEIFCTLLKGGTLVLAPKEVLADPPAFSRLLNKHKVELITLPPSYQSVIKDEVTRLKTVVSAGEMLNAAIATGIQRKGIKLINAYGPTENTVCATLSESPFHESGAVIIGKPLLNVQIYLLDKNLEPVPIGVVGEIHIAGTGLARGYLKRPALTEEKFISNPFCKTPGARMYKTGDAGKWLEDGNVEYIGRMDDQVKIRGYRIEPGEVENVLQQCRLVHQGVVMARTGNSGDLRLVGYVSPKGIFDKEGILNYLKSKLPDYLVPALLLEVDEFPLTVSGKIDRKRLPDPDKINLQDLAPMGSGNEPEQQLTRIWQELLGIEHIGLDDNVFESGAHSLLAIRAISVIRKEMGIEVQIGDIFDHPTIRQLASHLAGPVNSDILPPINGQPRPTHIPLSFSQERLWFIDRMDGSTSYHIPMVLRLHGPLKVASLEYALQQIINRHEILRTIIREENGQSSQFVLPKEGWNMGLTDNTDLKTEPDQLNSFIKALISLPFDLSADHTLRAHLIRLGNEEAILVVVLHHIASDGWSGTILIKEFIELYTSHIEGREVQLSLLPVQYADYAIWQRNYLTGELLEKKLGYWRQRLAGVSPLNLPVDYARPSVLSTRGAALRFILDEPLARGLQDLSHQEGVTLFMTLLSAFQVLLHRYSGQTDISIGSPVAGRQQAEVEELIGFFVNTLVLRSEWEGNPEFTAFLQRVKQTTLEAYEHQEAPFEKVVEAVTRERDMSRSPLFQVMFVLQNNDRVAAGSGRFGGLELITEMPGHTTSKFDLTCSVVGGEEGMEVILEYCTDLYREDTIRKMACHYTELLRSVVKEPGKRIGDLSMLAPGEREQLVMGFNNTESAYPSDKTMVDLFVAQAGMTPEKPAVVFEGQTLTYKELDERSNQLGHYLRGKMIKEDSLVAICLDRSPEMVIGILGILKAGGAYVPIDPDYPSERIGFMLRDTEASIVLCSRSCRPRLPLKEGLEYIELDSQWEEIVQEGRTRPSTRLSPDNLAYVIYTSGSTGKPKGVMIEHKSLVASTWARRSYYPDVQSAFLLSSFSFDSSIALLFGALLTGGCLILCKTESIRDRDIVGQLLKQSELTLCVPSFYSFLLDEGLIAGSGLAKVILAGENLNEALVARHYKETTGIILYNEYGPTECTVWATVTSIREDDQRITIGKPIENTYIYITDNQGQLCPVGIEGEICIGGAGLARGYLKQPDLTGEKFVADPFRANQGARIYKTGDRGEWLSDGRIRYLGRADEQVKIRGYRIEPGEIENVLLQNGDVREVAVVPRVDGNGNKQLVAYLVGNALLDKEKIYAHLKKSLPEYMIPGILVELDTMPLMPNGKINKQGLPDANLNNAGGGRYEAPRNETEQVLVSIWQQLLGIDRIGIHDDFFELGGHSLLALRVISYMEKEFSTKISIKSFFQFKCIAELAEYIEIIDAHKKSKSRTGLEVYEL